MKPRTVRLFDRIARMVAGSRSAPSPGPAALYWATSPETGTRANLLSNGKHRLPDRPADVLEVDVNALRAGRPQPVGEIGALVIDGRVEAKFVLHVRAFLWAARDADRPGA